MSLKTEYIPISASFWQEAAQRFLHESQSDDWRRNHQELNESDYSHSRVVVPTFEHAQLFLQALSKEVKTQYIPPRIHTMFAWLGMQAPTGTERISANQKLMTLYGELRQHAWLKNLFSAKSNTEILPLAQTLLSLSDELTQAWLPLAKNNQFEVNQIWLKALAQLPLPVHKLCSDEAQLVWSIWQSQLDEKDSLVQDFASMLQIANKANDPLFWITPTKPSIIEHAFLDAYQLKNEVVCLTIDWRAAVINNSMKQAWPDLLEEKLVETPLMAQCSSINTMNFSHLSLCAAKSLEDEAEQAAQHIIQWLQKGKQKIAVIAQDRVVSRRVRALLERANIVVADETGWKLSTTRAAAGVMAWFELLHSRAESLALLDFIKSPFFYWENKELLVMEVELNLRKANVTGGWETILYSLEDHQAAREMLVTVSRLAHAFLGKPHKKTINNWAIDTLHVLTELGLQASLQLDCAGDQIIRLFQSLQKDCMNMKEEFSFSEWRAFVNMQMESTPFTIMHSDKRVVMLPLNGARLRHFDAVYILGGDAKHLPSKAKENLFFTNAVRRECGLQTREERQQQQLRDFAEVLLSNSEVILSWQAKINGEHNALSPWVSQVELMLERQGMPRLKSSRLVFQASYLILQTIKQAMPKAAALMPASISASGLSSLLACPYQFFAGRMLRLNGLDEFSEKPEKRDYGDWLHAILKSYHDKIKNNQISNKEEKEKELRQISEDFFLRVMKKSPAALGYSERWKRVIPAYLDWANQREAEGWQFEMGESWEEQALTWEIDGMQSQVLLKGRIDRIDRRTLENGEDEFAVLDYKTKNNAALKKRIKEAEDHQLAFYGLLNPHKADEASYVALELDKEQIGDAPVSDFSKWKSELKSAIQINMQAIQSNQALPAQGVESVCHYCEMRGLCRKGAWL